MKTQIILSLYDQLLAGSSVKREDACVAFGISERTFYRYVKEISKYLSTKKTEYILTEKEGLGEYSMKRLED